jgi:hypothetical protein
VRNRFNRFHAFGFIKFNVYRYNQGFENVELSTADGALEAAPAMGAADCILDLVSSGTTLRENNLKQIEGGRVIESQVGLALFKHVISPSCDFSQTLFCSRATFRKRYCFASKHSTTDCNRYGPCNSSYILHPPGVSATLVAGVPGGVSHGAAEPPRDAGDHPRDAGAHRGAPARRRALHGRYYRKSNRVQIILGGLTGKETQNCFATRVLQRKKNTS